MAKIFLILVLASIVECAGIAILSGGLKEINRRDGNLPPTQILRIIRDGATNGKILLGIALEAVFFGALLYLLSKCDVSFVWPLTSLGFIVTTLAARFLLHENVTATRWAGVLLIAIGAAVTSYSEAAKKPASPAAPPAAADSSPARSQ